MWSAKKCTKGGMKLHEAIHALMSLPVGAYRAPSSGVGPPHVQT